MLAADDNIQVVQPTTPAQYFHVLRRQVVRPYRKPLVVMTPKSLLRHPEATSSLDDLAAGTFQRVIGDDTVDPTATQRILLCSGKVFYELRKQRAERQRDDVAILRVEQLYPLSDTTLGRALAAFPDGTPAVWVQEEPANMGAGPHIRLRSPQDVLGRFPLTVASRPASASPATGSAASHKLEQQRLMDQAFGD
jgi:2-oxoglutarate dehydrogenase E1 component